MRTTPKLLLPTDYIHDVTENIKRAKKHVSLVCMVFADDSSTKQLLSALSEAAKRGVAIEVAADIFTYIELGGLLFPTRRRSKQYNIAKNMGKHLKKSGVKFTWLGKSHTTLISGRTHIKWCIVDDNVFSFGGVNLYQAGINNNDYMFRINDSRLADTLMDEFHRLVRADAGNYSYRSHDFKYGDDIVLIDGGLIGDSIIYRRACKLAAVATKVILVSQYCPTGKLSKILKKVDSKIYFNAPSNAKSFNKILIQFSMLLTGHKTLYTRSEYLHAKFMIFKMPDGRHIALTGSHNFVNAGRLLGTREIALQTENPKIIRQLEEFLKENVA